MVKEKFQNNSLCNILRVIMIILTVALGRYGDCFIFLDVTIYLHYRRNLEYLKLKNELHPEASLFSSKLYRKLLLELLLCSIVIPPGVEFSRKNEILVEGTFQYSLNAIFLFLTLLKSYVLVRVFSNFSRWRSQRARKTCKKVGVKNSIQFSLRCEIHQRPYTCILVLFILSVVYSGIMIRTFEK